MIVLGEARFRLLSQRAIGHWYFMSEEHSRAACRCSYCVKAYDAGKMFFWPPAFKYWHKGWWVLGWKTASRNRYWRFA